MTTRHEGPFPCPCCGHLVFNESPGSYEICPVCFWEDDISQLRWPDSRGGANRPSLIQAQNNFRRWGAIETRLVACVRRPFPSEPLDPTWRPFDPDVDEIEPWVSGYDYGSSYASDPTTYFYWR